MKLIINFTLIARRLIFNLVTITFIQLESLTPLKPCNENNRQALFLCHPAFKNLQNYFNLFIQQYKRSQLGVNFYSVGSSSQAVYCQLLHCEREFQRGRLIHHLSTDLRLCLCIIDQPYVYISSEAHALYPMLSGSFLPLIPDLHLLAKTKIIWIRCGVKYIINSAGFIQKFLP